MLSVIFLLQESQVSQWLKASSWQRNVHLIPPPTPPPLKEKKLTMLNVGPYGAERELRWDLGLSPSLSFRRLYMPEIESGVKNDQSASIAHFTWRANRWFRWDVWVQGRPCGGQLCTHHSCGHSVNTFSLPPPVSSSEKREPRTSLLAQWSPSLTTLVHSLGSTYWKQRTESLRLFSDLHTRTCIHACTQM